MSGCSFRKPFKTYSCCAARPPRKKPTKRNTRNTRVTAPATRSDGNSARDTSRPRARTKVIVVVVPPQCAAPSVIPSLSNQLKVRTTTQTRLLLAPASSARSSDGGRATAVLVLTLRFRLRRRQSRTRARALLRLPGKKVRKRHQREHPKVSSCQRLELKALA